MWAGVSTLIIFLCLILSIVCSSKIGVNAGLLAMSFAFLMGVSFFDQEISTIIGFFPVDIILPFILGMVFFGYAKHTKVFEKISQWIIFIFRRRVRLLPFTIAFCSTLLTAMGCNVIASNTIMAPIAYTVAINMGYSPFLACIGIWAGTSAGAMPHLLLSTAVSRSIITGIMGPEYVETVMWYKWVTSFVINYFYIFLVYFATGTHKKLKGKTVEADKPKSFTKTEIRVVLILLLYVIFTLVPSILNVIMQNEVTQWLVNNVNNYILMCMGIVAFNSLRIAPGKTVIKEDVSWDLIIMVIGTTILLKLMSVVGTADMVSAWLNESIPAFLLVPIIYLCGAIMTVFTNANVVLQTLAPLFFQVITANPDIPAIGAYVALWSGATGPTIAPFSTGGSMALMLCPEEYKSTQIRQQLIMMFVVTFVGLLVSLLGWFNWMRP